MADIPYISLPDNEGGFTCGCLCLGRVGPTLTAVITGITECPDFVFGGINGVFSNIEWSDEFGRWEGIVGSINGFTAYLRVTCGYIPEDEFACEGWVMLIVAFDEDDSAMQAYSAVFAGELCPFPNLFGDPIPNTYTDCFIPDTHAGIDGFITLGVP